MNPAALSRRAGLAAATIALAFAAGSARGQDACGEWTPGLFESAGADGDVLALQAFDDGTGRALYVGGRFSVCGGVATNGVVRWDGSSWRSLGELEEGTGRSPGLQIAALAVHDDGRGPALYAGGYFPKIGGVPARSIARWDGFSWTPLGSGIVGGVHALASVDLGSGPRLFAAGLIVQAGSAAAYGIAQWDGTSWSDVGGGLDLLAVARALQAYDDGSGPALYVGGAFYRAGPVNAANVARWDGTSWSALGRGITGRGGSTVVRALAVHDDGTGPALYVGGYFARAGDTEAFSIARWDGAAFSAVGGRISGGGGAVAALRVFDDGVGGLVLFAGGSFTIAAGVPCSYVASWDGRSWSAPGGGLLLPVNALEAFARPDRRVLCAGSVAGLGAHNLVQWDGAGWGPLSRKALDAPVGALLAHDDGSGAALFAGGSFAGSGEAIAFHVARWDGAAWSPLGDGLGGCCSVVSALARYDDGTGSALYAGGRFDFSGNLRLRSVARWDGASWSDVGGGVNDAVDAFAVSDLEGPSALYAGGRFYKAGRVAASNVARWDGTAWWPLGDGLYSDVSALAVYDDGGGPALYAGGAFDSPLNHVARWDGVRWSDVGGGTDGPVAALMVFDDGSGPALYAGGAFTSPFPNLARWNGTSWSSVGGPAFDGPVGALAPFPEDGLGPAIYAAGEFTTPARRVARWSGSSWGSLGAGLDGPGACLAPFDDGSGPALYAGGAFHRTADGVASPFLARWADLCALRRGRVNVGAGPIADVLLVNGSSGGPERRVVLGATDPLTLTMAAPPSLTEAPFALYAWFAGATAASARELPLGLGAACRPMPLTEYDPALRVVWNNTGKRKLGAPNRPSSPAPSTILVLPAGLGRSGTFLLQGIIADGASAAAVRASATNGLEIAVN